MTRHELIVEVEAYYRGIAGELQDAIPHLAHRHLEHMPDPRTVPVAALRRLHAALAEFIAEAQQAENAKLLRR